MDTSDRSDPNVHGSPSGEPFLHPDWAHGAHPGQPAGASSGPGRRSIVRALASRWWKILLLWVLVSAPTSYLIYTLVEPTYEAISLLRVEPTTPDPYGGTLHVAPKMEEARSYLLTQTQLVKSDVVLDAALARREIGSLGMVESWQDPKAELKKELAVTIVGDNTYLIQVALSSRDAAEAAKIVNAVVEEYLAQHARYQRNSNRTLRNSLETERLKLENKIKETTDKMASLVKQGNTPMGVPIVSDPAGKGQDGPIDPSLDRVTLKQFQEMASWLLKVDFELMDAQARLEAARVPASQSPPEKIRELESAAEAVRRKRDSYKRYLARVKVENGSPDADALQTQLLNQDLQHLKRLHEVIKSKLAQLEFEIGAEAYRVRVQDKADVPKVPSNNDRVRYVAAAPLGVLVLVLGMFLVGEIRTRRWRGTDVTS